MQPVAVMSTVVGTIVLQVQDSKDPYFSEMPGHIIASALAIIVGAFICFLGLVRLGWLVDFISLAAIAAYMTGSALYISIGQVPTLLGLSSLFDTHQKSYFVVIRTLQYLPQTSLDAAMGLTALAMLYMIRSFFKFLARKQPHRRRFWYVINTLRTAFVILFYTFISAMVNLDLPGGRTEDSVDYSPFKILGVVPRGFQHAKVPLINTKIIKEFSSFIPVSIIVVLIEHISIAKSFGRINNYTINPSQEMVAIGVTNLLGPFLGAYPATGSFSRTAIKSNAGVRTPLAGVITALVVLLAIYALPPVFFYIPSAALSAVIIHAVGDLITPPNVVYQFWRASPFEVLIFFAGVFVTIFSSIENGIYTTITASLALYLFRVFKARGAFLGRVQVHSVIGDHLVGGDGTTKKSDDESEASTRNIFLPIDSKDGSNPNIKPQHPYPGIFIYRFSEGFNYPNANHYLDHITHHIFAETQRTDPHTYGRVGDRPWNDPGPRKGHEVVVEDRRPTLKAVIVDFSSVDFIDITSLQMLIDVRNQLDRYATPNRVQWHFAHVTNRWTKRALASAGFGYAAPDDDALSDWKPIFSVADVGGSDSAAAEAERRQRAESVARGPGKVGTDIEAGHRTTQREVDSISGGESSESDPIEKEFRTSKAYGRTDVRVAAVTGLNRPFFHTDLTSALQSAIKNTEKLHVVEADQFKKSAAVDESFAEKNLREKTT